jgi:uncharacterized membrane protein
MTARSEASSIPALANSASAASRSASAVEATLASGFAAILLYTYLTTRRNEARLSARMRRSAVPFVAIGVLAGLNTVLIFEALERGRVTVVSPLVGTAMLWTLVFSVILLGRGEGLGRRVVGSALLVALISVTRGGG